MNPEPAARPRRPALPRMERLGVAVSSDTGGRLPLGRARVTELVRFVLRRERVRDALVSVTFVGPRRSAALNREHLGHRGATDVITFALGGDAPVPVVGDIYVCPDVVRAQAARFGVSVRAEFERVVVHATLHVLGYEHPEDDGRERSPMWRRQEVLLAAFQRRRTT